MAISRDYEHRPAAWQGETVEFRALYALSFVFFLVAAVLARLVPQMRSGRGANRSVLQEARIAASNSIPFAFM